MEKIFIFDEFGDRYEVTNIVAMLDELPDDGLEMIYKSSRYYNEFNKTIEELKSKGAIQQVEGEDYDVEAVEKGLEYFAETIEKRLGKETLDKWIEETDAQWEANKPDSKIREN
jgi:arsenate reductase-like glutaredoxin family protein